ncbi:TonB-dependent receptor [Sphingomonas sp. KR3-1]|uniref:TonB-dependent receptor domain-containing protein n=1 Tax=Sphingomonas sp. KR3-1 TaxID=3156611 RepID=UPI0032B3AE3A
MFAFATAQAHAQDAQSVAASPQPQQQQQEKPEREPAEPSANIVVVGSQIRGAQIEGILPVTVADRDDIDAQAATDGDDLFRAIPQNGDVAFNESRDTGGINDARGDVGSVNLRGLGTGNTLVLLNGRRLVLHPGVQAENLIPVVSVNTNAIPVTGVERVEVLLEGAAAIYGTDAVAGVVNTVLKTRFDGLTIDTTVGQTDGTQQTERQVNFEWGKTFNGGRTNISLFGTYNKRDPLYASERRNSRSSDLRPLVADTAFAGDGDFDNRSLDTMWGEFVRLDSNYQQVTTVARYNGTALTTSGTFHVQPSSNEGCIAPAGNGICFDNSVLSTASTDANLKYNTNADRTIQGGNERLNLFGFVNHEFSASLNFYGELGFYKSDFNSQREQETPLATQRLIIPATAYWNPFGVAGSPNRLPGLTGVSTDGVALELQDYRFVDAGPLNINVKNTTLRFLGGLRGNFGHFDFDTAALYSRADTTDTMETISMTLLQQSIAGTTAAAYNPFNGGDPSNPGSVDSTPNPRATIDSFLVDVYRKNSTTLALWDFKISNARLLRLPGGNVGFAAGVEVRRETYRDDRDPRLDGTITYTALDGTKNGSDVMGASPTPDSGGGRTVESAFVELAVPLVSRGMHVPFVRSLAMQLAGRVENYTSFGMIAKPKVAVGWTPIDGLQFRSAWSLGFRAPNLPQLFENGVQRSNTRTDWINCEADVRAGRIANFDACTRSVAVVSNRSGSQSLKPEESSNFTAGVVFQPPMPAGLGRLTFTVDYWRIHQTNLIGLFGDNNALTLDYYLRLKGSSNPLVQRDTPTATEIANYAGTGLTAPGRVIQVIDDYANLNPRTVRGLDLAMAYRLHKTPIGDFDFKVNAAHLIEFYQDPDAQKATLIAAQASGAIDATIPISGAESLLRQNGRPTWRFTSTITWRKDGWGLGYYNSYVGSVEDTSASLPDGTLWEVSDVLTHNLYGQYSFGRKAGVLSNTRFRIGARNLLNTLPPIADGSYGYLGELHSIRGRYIYASIRKRF